MKYGNFRQVRKLITPSYIHVQTVNEVVFYNLTFLVRSSEMGEHREQYVLLYPPIIICILRSQILFAFALSQSCITSSFLVTFQVSWNRPLLAPQSVTLTWQTLQDQSWLWLSDALTSPSLFYDHLAFESRITISHLLAASNNEKLLKCRHRVGVS